MKIKRNGIKISLSMFVLLLSIITGVIILHDAIYEKKMHLQNENNNNILNLKGICIKNEIYKELMKSKINYIDCDNHSISYYFGIMIKCMISFAFGGIINEFTFIKMGFF